jgi:hypothetical protein
LVQAVLFIYLLFENVEFEIYRTAFYVFYGCAILEEEYVLELFTNTKLNKIFDLTGIK